MLFINNNSALINYYSNYYSNVTSSSLVDTFECLVGTNVKT